jgi:hypothetical protein
MINIDTLPCFCSAGIKPRALYLLLSPRATSPAFGFHFFFLTTASHFITDIISKRASYDNFIDPSPWFSKTEAWAPRGLLSARTISVYHHTPLVDILTLLETF